VSLLFARLGLGEAWEKGFVHVLRHERFHASRGLPRKLERSEAGFGTLWELVSRPFSMESMVSFRRNPWSAWTGKRKQHKAYLLVSYKFNFIVKIGL
jgi:hypothetical protein